jgi:hypothetical protein
MLLLRVIKADGPATSSSRTLGGQENLLESEGRVMKEGLKALVSDILRSYGRGRGRLTRSGSDNENGSGRESGRGSGNGRGSGSVSVSGSLSNGASESVSWKARGGRSSNLLK